MQKLTAEELIFRVENHRPVKSEGEDDEEYGERYNGNLGTLEEVYYLSKEQKISMEFGEIEEVKRTSHENEDCELILHFKDHGIFLKQTGWYTSYSGSDWNDNIYEVKPHPVTTIIYK